MNLSRKWNFTKHIFGPRIRWRLNNDISPLKNKKNVSQLVLTTWDLQKFKKASESRKYKFKVHTFPAEFRSRILKPFNSHLQGQKEHLDIRLKVKSPKKVGKEFLKKMVNLTFHNAWHRVNTDVFIWKANYFSKLESWLEKHFCLQIMHINVSNEFSTS